MGWYRNERVGRYRSDLLDFVLDGPAGKNLPDRGRGRASSRCVHKRRVRGPGAGDVRSSRVSSRSMAGHTRVLSEGYTPTNQRAALEEAPVGWRYDLVGRLRLDLVTHERVVLPDSHLFDGPAFLAEDPFTLLSEIQRVRGEVTAPLVIKARKKSLNEALGHLLFRDEFLNGFPFNALKNDSLAGPLADALRRTPKERLERYLARHASSARAVSDLLRDLTREIGVDAGDLLAEMETGWARWLEAEARGLFVVEPWEGSYDLPGALQYSYIDAFQITRTRDVLEEARRLLSGESAYRGDVTRLLRAARSGATEEEQAEIEAIERWASRTRHWALALQHGCGLRTQVRDNDPWASRYQNLIEEGDRDGGGETLPVDFIRRLGRLPTEDFQMAIDSVAIENWQATSDRSELERAMSRLVDCVSDRVPAEGSRRFVDGLIEMFVAASPALPVAAAEVVTRDAPGWSPWHTAGAIGAALVGAYRTKIAALPSGRRRLVRQLVEYAVRPRAAARDGRLS